MTAAQIARELGGKRSGSGYIAKCVSHDDRNPSLSISEQHGTVLVHCHAGCEQRDVVDALKALGLWPEREEQHQDRDIESIYDYVDEDNALVYQIVRKRGKKFLQRRPDGKGGWIWKKHPRQVLYHLPEVIEAAIIFIAEGEKDCEALRDHGFCATCNSGGAGKWQPEFNRFFAGKEVCILPDADPAGWKHALDVARGIVGIAAKVQMLELPGAKDAAEWFAAGHSELELIELVEAPCHQ